MEETPMNKFAVLVHYGEVEGMYMNGKPAKLKDFLHTEFWDMVNNVVTLVQIIRDKYRDYYLGTVTNLTTKIL
jgi:hypothetical protein